MTKPHKTLKLTIRINRVFNQPAHKHPQTSWLVRSKLATTWAKAILTRGKNKAMGCSQSITLNLPMLIWLGKPACESPERFQTAKIVATMRIHILSARNQLLVWIRLRTSEEKHEHAGEEIHKMRRSLSLSPLTARTHVESVPAQLQRSAAPASASASAADADAAGAPAFYLKDGGEGGWWGGRERSSWWNGPKRGERIERKQNVRGGKERKRGRSSNCSLLSSSSRHCRVEEVQSELVGGGCVCVQRLSITRMKSVFCCLEFTWIHPSVPVVLTWVGELLQRQLCPALSPAGSEVHKLEC